jgi:hypothetical protein
MGDEPPNALDRTVFCGGSYKRFGALTAVDAREKAEELGAAGGWGPLTRVAGVAQAWRELAAELDRAGAGSTVAALDAATAERYAGRLWVLPPGGSLL